MKIKKEGNFTWGWQTDALDCKLIVLLGWKNKRFRLDYARLEAHQGWIRIATKAKAWRIDQDGLYTISHYYFRHVWVH